MSAHSAVMAGRRAAERRFTETFTFFSESFGAIPEGGTDPAIVETVVHAAVPGRVKFPSLTVSDRQQAGQLIAVQSPEVHVAVGATPNVREGHFCRVTASTVDVSLVGHKFRISGWPQSGSVTASRYPVKEVS